MARGVGMLAVLLLTALAVMSPSGARSDPPPLRYYLALGDSLSVGVQPNARGAPIETDQGYADQLLHRERHQVPGLQLVKLGCPGETTASMLTGHGNAPGDRSFHCHKEGGSQLKAAIAFLEAHHSRGEVALVTVDIGGNDLDGCSAGGVNIGTCLADGLNAIKTNTPRILKAIRRAAAPGTAFSAMTLYDTTLTDDLSPVPATRALGAESVDFVRISNADIRRADRAWGFKTADVAAAFSTYATRTVRFNRQTVPIGVRKLCRLTWMCVLPPVGPNIHANATGYAVIAATLAKAVGRIRNVTS